MTENSKPQPKTGPEPDDPPDLSVSPWRETVER